MVKKLKIRNLFAANGDVSIWVKNSRVGRKPPYKQKQTEIRKNEYLYIEMMIKAKFMTPGAGFLS